MAQKVYLDSGDVTVMVDPMRLDGWIYEGSHAHLLSVKNGEAYDLRALERAMNWDKSHTPALELFMPTVNALNSVKKFVVQKFVDSGEWAGVDRDLERSGELPLITKQVYDGSLGDKSPGDIEHEMREAARRSAARVFDRSGQWR